MSNGPARMQSRLPARKVWVAAVANAAVALIAGIVNGIADGTPISGEIAGSAMTVISFLLSYFVPPAKDDQIVVS
jgi:hypothetical protein